MAGTFLSGISGAGYLKQKVSQEKNRSQQCGARFRNVEGGSQARGSAESVVGPVQIRQAVGYEHSRQNAEPPLPHIDRNLLLNAFFCDQCMSPVYTDL